MSKTVKRFLQAIAAVTLCVGLLPATADAATKKKVDGRRVHRTYAMAKHPSVIRAAIPAKPSFGELAGLHITGDELALKSSVAFVMDQDTREVLLSKNDTAVLPIASITKLMTGLLISEAKLPMDEMITVTQED